MTRPFQHGTLYSAILKKGQPNLRRQENLVKFRDRYVYVKRVECKIGNDKNLAYAYIGFDVDGSGDTNHKIIISSRKKAKSIDDMHVAFESTGIFILISSIAFGAEEILEVYYLYFENREGMFMALRNQKCEVFAERIVTYEGQSDANQFYKKLKIDYPISFTRRKDE